MKKITIFLSIIFFCLTMCINSYADNFKIIDEFLDMYMINDKTNMNLSKNSSSNGKSYVITNSKVILGDEMLFTDEYKHLIDSKKVGLVTNQIRKMYCIHIKMQNLHLYMHLSME